MKVKRSETKAVGREHWFALEMTGSAGVDNGMCGFK